MEEIKKISATPYNKPWYRKIVAIPLTGGVVKDLYEYNYAAPRYGNYGVRVADNLYIGETILSSGSSGYTTDTGVYASGRYIDQTASLSLIKLIGESFIYTSSSSGFESFIPVTSGDIQRYIMATGDCTAFIEYGPAIVKSNFVETDILSKKFPTWTDIYSSTGSVGYKFINVFGFDIEKAKMIALRAFEEVVPTLADDNQIYVIWKTELSSNEPIISVSGDGEILGMAEDLVEFMNDPSGYLYYKEGNSVYTNREFSELYINGVRVSQQEELVFNIYDTWARQFGLERLDGETNSELLTRIKDVYRNPPGATYERLKAAIVRDTGIPSGSIEIYELSNSKLPWQELTLPRSTNDYVEQKDLARWINVNSANSWNYMRSGHALWSRESDIYRYGEVPNLLDQAPTSVENGVGYGDDLLVSHIEEPEELPYSISLYVVGKQQQDISYYPRVTAWGELTATANITTYDNAVDWVASLLVYATGSSSGSYLKEVSGSIAGSPYERYSPYTSQASYIIEDSTGSCLFYKEEISGAITEIPCQDIVSGSVRIRTYNFNTGTWSSDATGYVAYIEDIPGQTGWTVTELGRLPRYITVSGTKSVASTGVWTSTPIPFTVSCNGLYPATSPQPGVASCPIILYPPSTSGAYTYISSSGFQPQGATGNITIDGSDPFINGLPGTGTTINLSSNYTKTLKRTSDYISSAYTVTGTINRDTSYIKIAVPSADIAVPSSVITGECIFKLTSSSGVTAHMESYEYSPTGANIYVFPYAGTHPTWSLGVHGGTYYLAGNEYIIYPNKYVQSVSGTTSGFLMDMYPAFGYPILISASGVTSFKEIQSLDPSGNISITVYETVTGNGTQYLEAAYNNIYDITVDGASKSVYQDNLIDYGSTTSTGTSYDISYKVSNSFVVDYNNISSGLYRPYIMLDSEYTNVVAEYSTYSEYFDEDEQLIDTEAPLSPFLRHPKETFLYLGTSGVSTPTSIEFIDSLQKLYKGETNNIWLYVTDSYGNGVEDQLVTVTTGGINITGYSNPDGYAVIPIYVSTGESASSVSITGSVGSVSGIVTYLIDDSSVIPNSDINLFYRSYSISDSSYPPFIISGYLHDANYSPMATQYVTGTVLCPDSSSVSEPTLTNYSGIFGFSYTPSQTGRHIVEFSYESSKKSTSFYILER